MTPTRTESAMGVQFREISPNRYEVIRPEMTPQLIGPMLEMNRRFRAAGFRIEPQAEILADGRIVTAFIRR